MYGGAHRKSLKPGDGACLTSFSSTCAVLPLLPSYGRYLSNIDTDSARLHSKVLIITSRKELDCISKDFFSMCTFIMKQEQSPSHKNYVKYGKGIRI